MIDSRPGLTLVELVLALSLTGLTLAVGFGVLQGVQTGHTQIVEESRHRTAEMGGRRMLRDLLSRIDRAGGDALLFTGTSRYLAFDTWCSASGNALAACRVRIALERAGDATIVHAEWNFGKAELAVVLADARFVFREMSGSGSAWHEQWGQSQQRPESVGLISGADTILLPVGAAR